MTDISAVLIEKVLEAYHARQPLKIVGGNTKHFMGRKTSGSTLNVSGHCGIVSYEPTELVITARSGTRITDIKALLADHNQYLAFEPATFAGNATLGGALACNQSGPGRPWLGAFRDAVLGVKLINGRGEHLRFGGQVMKNVAGYDLSRLQAGALGTLGVITEISLKVLPKPATETSLVQELTEAKALAVLTALRQQAVPLTGACWVNGRLILRLAGAQSAVRDSAARLGGQILPDKDSFWHDLSEQKHPVFSSDLPLWRFSICPSSGPLTVDKELENQLLIDWGAAQRWLCGNYQNQDLQALARSAKGHVSLYRGGDRSNEVFQSPSGPLKALQINLKKALDPHSILNPGRLYSWL